MMALQRSMPRTCSMFMSGPHATSKGQPAPPAYRRGGGGATGRTARLGVTHQVGFRIHMFSIKMLLINKAVRGREFLGEPQRHAGPALRSEPLGQHVSTLENHSDPELLGL